MNREEIMSYRSVVNLRVFAGVLLVAVGLLAGCDRGAAPDSQAVAEGPSEHHVGDHGVGDHGVGENGDTVATGQAVGGQVEIKEDVPREHYYSPFVVTVDGDVVFKTVTFTDVGIRQPLPGPVDETLLETIAESLAQHLSRSETLGYEAKIYHDAAAADPNNHLFCEESHLYVAIWKGYSPDRWGYSLWSGCNEEHQFAWKEVVIPKSAANDMIESVKTLSVSIVESLEKATKENCFLSEC